MVISTGCLPTLSGEHLSILRMEDLSMLSGVPGGVERGTVPAEASLWGGSDWGARE